MSLTVYICTYSLITVKYVRHASHNIEHIAGYFSYKLSLMIQKAEVRKM